MSALSAVVLPFPDTPTEFAMALARYRASVAHFNALPDHLELTDEPAFRAAEDDHIEAFIAVVEGSVADWNEFTDLLSVMADDGGAHIEVDRAAHLLKEARRLVGQVP